MRGLRDGTEGRVRIWKTERGYGSLGDGFKLNQLENATL